jgi:hypothetical protein
LREMEWRGREDRDRTRRMQYDWSSDRVNHRARDAKRLKDNLNWAGLTMPPCPRTSRNNYGKHDQRADAADRKSSRPFETRGLHPSGKKLDSRQSAEKETSLLLICACGRFAPPRSHRWTSDRASKSVTPPSPWLLSAIECSSHDIVLSPESSDLTSQR